MTTRQLFDYKNYSTTQNSYTNATTDRPWTTYPLFIAAQYLLAYYPAFLLMFGIFGNVMIIIIMRRAKSDESAIDVYFIAMAVFDLICLCVDQVPQLVWHAFRFNIRTLHNLVCKLIVWLNTGSGTVSAWCLVCMTVHRAVSVAWPHRVNVLCTRRAVLLVFIGTTVFLALLYSHYLIGIEIADVSHVGIEVKHTCTVRYDNESYTAFLTNIFVYIELLVYSLLPFTFLALSNIFLIRELGQSIKAVNATLTQGDSRIINSRKKANNHVTLTMIVVSLAFIVLTLPSSIDSILNSLTISHNRATGSALAKHHFITTVCISISQANSAVNFYMYCLTGRRFREEFLKVLYCGRNRERRGSSQ